jgi:hypothetical protein
VPGNVRFTGDRYPSILVIVRLRRRVLSQRRSGVIGGRYPGAPTTLDSNLDSSRVLLPWGVQVSLGIATLVLLGASGMDFDDLTNQAGCFRRSPLWQYSSHRDLQVHASLKLLRFFSIVVWTVSLDSIPHFLGQFLLSLSSDFPLLSLYLIPSCMVCRIPFYY